MSSSARFSGPSLFEPTEPSYEPTEINTDTNNGKTLSTVSWNPTRNVGRIYHLGTTTSGGSQSNNRNIYHDVLTVATASADDYCDDLRDATINVFSKYSDGAPLAISSHYRGDSRNGNARALIQSLSPGSSTGLSLGDYVEAAKYWSGERSVLDTRILTALDMDESAKGALDKMFTQTDHDDEISEVDSNDDEAFDDSDFSSDEEGPDPRRTIETSDVTPQTPYTEPDTSHRAGPPPPPLVRTNRPAVTLPTIEETSLPSNSRSSNGGSRPSGSVSRKRAPQSSISNTLSYMSRILDGPDGDQDSYTTSYNGLAHLSMLRDGLVECSRTGKWTEDPIAPRITISGYTVEDLVDMIQVHKGGEGASCDTAAYDSMFRHSAVGKWMRETGSLASGYETYEEGGKIKARLKEAAAPDTGDETTNVNTRAGEAAAGVINGTGQVTGPIATPFSDTDSISDSPVIANQDSERLPKRQILSTAATRPWLWPAAYSAISETRARERASKSVSTRGYTERDVGIRDEVTGTKGSTAFSALIKSAWSRYRSRTSRGYEITEATDRTDYEDERASDEGASDDGSDVDPRASSASYLGSYHSQGLLTRKRRPLGSTNQTSEHSAGCYCCAGGLKKDIKRVGKASLYTATAPFLAAGIITAGSVLAAGWAAKKTGSLVGSAARSLWSGTRSVTQSALSVGVRVVNAVDQRAGYTFLAATGHHGKDPWREHWERRQSKRTTKKSMSAAKSRGEMNHGPEDSVHYI